MSFKSDRQRKKVMAKLGVKQILPVPIIGYRGQRIRVLEHPHGSPPGKRVVTYSGPIREKMHMKTPKGYERVPISGALITKKEARKQRRLAKKLLGE